MSFGKAKGGRGRHGAEAFVPSAARKAGGGREWAMEEDRRGFDPVAPPAELSASMRAWDAAAGDWTAAVRGGLDPARAVTDRAIAKLVRQVPPGPVLDAGCGEGWLSRELAGHGVSVTAIDGAPRMVALAAEACPVADYRWVSFAEAADEPRRLGGAFGTVVFNYSLLEERVTPILDAAGSVLFPYGRILIQAAHPFAADPAGGGYRDGWRVLDQAAPGVPLTPPQPWYFRTFSTWILELRRAGLLLVETYEPLDPDGRPASLIIHATIPERRRG
ncbi:MAG TPA: class I SAM-dependent methyltransferase [Longimicrobium sp.]|nr:class I SAM-dependent methyltransferase [Longimicrobium sp.]